MEFQRGNTSPDSFKIFLLHLVMNLSMSNIRVCAILVTTKINIKGSPFANLPHNLNKSIEEFVYIFHLTVSLFFILFLNFHVVFLIGFSYFSSQCTMYCLRCTLSYHIFPPHVLSHNNAPFNSLGLLKSDQLSSSSGLSTINAYNKRVTFAEHMFY